MDNNKTLSAPRYILCNVIGGKTYQLTGLGVFKSGLAAREAYASEPRNGVAYVLELRDVSRHGVCYGIEEQIVGSAVRGS